MESITIAFLKNRNFLKVQGATEAYYVFNYFEEKKGTEVILISIRPPGSIFDLFRYVLQVLRAVVVLRKCDVVYSYKGYFFLPLFGSFGLGKKVIYDFRTPPVLQKQEFRKLEGLNWKRKLILVIKKKLYKIILPHTDLIVTLSEDIQHILTKQYNVPSARIHLLPLGVDFEKFNPCKFNGESFTDEEISMVCVSSIAGIWRAKELKTVLEGLKLLKKKNIKVSLSIIGKIPEKVKNYINNYARKENVRTLLQFKGYIPHKRVPYVLSLYDIALSPLPDLQSYRVASPAKLFEYLAMRKIVLASNIKCHKRVIEHGINGVLYETGNPKDFAVKIEKILNEPAFRHKIQENTRESVKKHDWGLLISKLYKKLRN